MAESVTEIQAKFTANIAELQAGVVKAQSSIGGVGGALVATTRAGASTGRGVKKALTDIGQAARFVGPLVGGVAGEVVLLGSSILSAGKSAAVGIRSLLGPFGLAAVAIAGVAAAIAVYVFKSERAAIAAERNKGSVGALTESIKKQKAALEDILNVKDINKAAIDSAKEEIDGLKKLIANAADLEISIFTVQDPEKRVADLEKELARLTSASNSAAESTAKFNIAITEQQKIQKELDDGLKILERDYANGGDKLDFLSGKVNLYKKAKEEALKVDGVHDSIIQNYNRTIKAAVREQEDASKRIAAAKQIEIDAIEKATRAAVEARNVQDRISKAQTFVNKPIADILISAEQQALITERLAQTKQQFIDFYTELEVSAADFQRLGIETFNSFAQGVGDAVAQIAVYGADTAAVFEALLKQIAASIISSLVTLAIQELAFLLIGTGIAASRTAVEMASAAAITYSAVFAGTAVAAIGLGPLSIAAAAAAAGAAVAAMISGAALASTAGGIAGLGNARPLAEGAIITGPTFALIGEGREKEYVLPQSKLDRLVESGGKDGTYVNLMVDGRTMASWVVRHMPAVLRLNGVRGV